jgi:hypothetical protein
VFVTVQVPIYASRDRAIAAARFVFGIVFSSLSFMPVGGPPTLRAGVHYYFESARRHCGARVARTVAAGAYLRAEPSDGSVLSELVEAGP